MAQAQGPVDAALRGRVVGAHAGGTQIVVRASNGDQQTIVANADGSFVVLRLVPGDYSVAAGGVAQDIVLTAGAIGEVTLPLNRQATPAAVPLWSDGNTFTQADLLPLPLEGGEWENLAALDPYANDATPATGTSSETEDQPAVAREEESDKPIDMSYAGAAAMGEEDTIDGLSAQQFFRSGTRGSATGGARSTTNFAASAIGSLRVMPRTFSAQYSGGAGGAIAIATRHYADHLHGSVFLMDRQSAWAATNPFAVETHYRDGVVSSALVKPGNDYQNLGIALGAPLKAHWLPSALRANTGIFGSLEEQLHEQHLVSSPEVASFYALTQEQVLLLGNRGVNAAQTNTALNYLDSLTGTTVKTSGRTLGYIRADTRLAQHDDLTVAYAGQRFNGLAAVGQVAEAVVHRGMGSLGTSHLAVDALTARWLHRFSPRFNHELRFQLAHDLESEAPDKPLPQEPAIAPDGYAPQVSIEPNGFVYGTTASLGRAASPDEQRVQLADGFELLVHHNLISIGADWSRITDRTDSFTNQFGSFLYDGGITNGHDGGLVDWISDYTYNVNAYPNGACPSITYAQLNQPHYFCFRSFTQSFGPQASAFTVHELAGFVEDSLRLRDNLLLNVGVRYDYTLLPLPQAPNYVLDQTFAALGSSLGNPLGGATETFPEDRNNVGPRIGVLWSAQRKHKRWFTAQLGYGAFYGRVPGQTLRAALRNTAVQTYGTQLPVSTPVSFERIRISPTTETLCPQVTAQNQGFGYPCDYTSLPPAAVMQTSSATLFAANYRAPAIQRATLTLEREVTQHIDLRVGYAGAIATQLPTSVDRNIAPSTTLATYQISGGAGQKGIVPGALLAIPFYGTRLSQNYGPVTVLVSSANATYHAGHVEARVHTGDVEARGTFTFSRAIDYAPQQSATPRENGQFDPFHNGYDKGLSNQDIPVRFSGEFTYGLRVTQGPPRLAAALTGVRLSAIAAASSGAPYSYMVFGSTGLGLTGGGDSLNNSGGATYLPSVGRNTLRLPARSKVDVRLGRGFRLPHARGEAFLQAFNVLNSVSVSRVETRAFEIQPSLVPNQPIQQLVFQDTAALTAEGLNTPAFGTPLSSTTGLGRERELELGVRIEF